MGFVPRAVCSNSNDTGQTLHKRTFPPMPEVCLASMHSHNWLVVLRPADPVDVVPRVRLVARIALVHLHMLLAGDPHGHRPKMLGGMARWRLMALRALLGYWRRVQIRRYPPGRGLMTPGACAPEELFMRLLTAVAARTVQGILLGGLRHVNPQKRGEVVDHLARHARMTRGTGSKVRSYPQQCGMVHLDRAGGSLVLHMAAAAIPNLRVKRRRLLAETGGGSGMARDASGRFYAYCGLVTRFALAPQERVLSRERTGLERGPPAWNRRRTRAVQRDERRRATQQSDGNQHGIELLHESHRSP